MSHGMMRGGPWERQPLAAMSCCDSRLMRNHPNQPKLYQWRGAGALSNLDAIACSRESETREYSGTSRVGLWSFSSSFLLLVQNVRRTEPTAGCAGTRNDIFVLAPQF